MSGHKNAFDCIKAFSETDFTEDLKAFDIPTLIIHGDDDQIVPIEASAILSSKIVKGSTLKIYPGGSHALMDTSKERLNQVIAGVHTEDKALGPAHTPPDPEKEEDADCFDIKIKCLIIEA